MNTQKTHPAQTSLLQPVINWWNSIPSNTRKWIIGLSVGVFLLLGIISSSVNKSRGKQETVNPTNQPPVTSQSKTPETPTRPQTQQTETTIVQNLAIIEGVRGNEAKVSRIRTLLTQLNSKYPENEQQIGDMTAAAYNEIQKKDQSASIIGIMEAMIKVSESKTKTTYADAITSYALLRVSGMK